MKGVGKMGGSRLGTSSCLIDLKFLPGITVNLRNLEPEWADLNPQNAFLQTGLIDTGSNFFNQVLSILVSSVPIFIKFDKFLYNFGVLDVKKNNGAEAVLKKIS